MVIHGLSIVSGRQCLVYVLPRLWYTKEYMQNWDIMVNAVHWYAVIEFNWSSKAAMLNLRPVAKCGQMRHVVRLKKVETHFAVLSTK